MQEIPSMPFFIIATSLLFSSLNCVYPLQKRNLVDQLWITKALSNLPNNLIKWHSRKQWWLRKCISVFNTWFPIAFLSCLPENIAYQLNHYEMTFTALWFEAGTPTPLSQLSVLNKQSFSPLSTYTKHRKHPWNVKFTPNCLSLFWRVG